MQDLMMTHEIASILSSVPLAIKAAAMFGSRAKGGVGPESDLDLLVIAEKLPPQRHRRTKEIAAIKACFPHAAPLDILLLTPAECEANFRNHNPLFLDIARDAVILMDTDGFLEAMIEETRAYIERAGLKKIPDGWIYPVRYRSASPLSPVTNRDFAMAMLADGERDLRIGVRLKNWSG